jgi:hypothetical protein
VKLEALRDHALGMEARARIGFTLRWKRAAR